RAAPELLVLEQRAGIKPAEHDAADIGERIPADGNRTDRDRDRIEHREFDEEGKHQAGLDKVAFVESEQPLPMPLGGVTMIDGTFREGEAVMRAGIDLDLVLRTLHA